ncbi:MAG TPA: ester cyclase [Bacteroidota bacterium]|nr:ester cyclase [Bacteroidota bacterium]
MNSLSKWVVQVCTALVSGLLAVNLGGCSEYASPDVRAMKEMAIKYTDEKSVTDRRLGRLDKMDFDAIAKQQWEPFRETHDDSVVVQWPDGHSTKGIAAHIQEARALLAFAPDSWVEGHPIRFGSGEWTCTTSTIVGTFTNPVYTAEGKLIQPTGKRFRVSVCTIARWKDNRIIEESLFWDNQAIMNQLRPARKWYAKGGQKSNPSTMSQLAGQADF